MDPELRKLFERELSELKERLPELQKESPLLNRLLPDPHVERILEGVALMAARIHDRLDNTFPDITEALIERLHPHLLEPVPSYAIVQATAMPDSTATQPDFPGLPAETQINVRKLRESYAAKFRTCYPIRTLALCTEGQSSIKFSQKPGLYCTGRLSIPLRTVAPITFRNLNINRLRFFLDGEKAGLLRELMLAKVKISLHFSDASEEQQLSGAQFSEVGFAESEGLLPAKPPSLFYHRMLFEYFCYPLKHMFVDLTGPSAKESWFNAASAPDTDRARLMIDFKDFPTSVGEQIKQSLSDDTSAILLGCTPIINLYSQTLDEIRDIHRRHEHTLSPGGHPRTEIFRIDNVKIVASRNGDLQTRQAHPLFGARLRSEEVAPTYWSSRRTVEEGGNVAAPEIHHPDTRWRTLISFSTPHRDLQQLERENAHVTALLSDGDLPAFLGEDCEPVAVDLGGVHFAFVTSPSRRRLPLARRAMLLSLVSHFTTNHEDLLASNAGKLKDIVLMYEDPSGAAYPGMTRGMWSDSLKDLTITRSVARRGDSEGRDCICQGINAELIIDETNLMQVGGGHLFASVLHQFIALYATANSFAAVKATIIPNERTVRWPGLWGRAIAA